MEILMVNIFSIIVQAIASTYIMILLHNKIINITATKKQSIIMLSAVFFKTILCTILKNYLPGINSIISLILETSIITVIFKINPFKSLIIVIGNMCIFAITEIIAVYMVIFTFKTTMEGVLLSPLKLLCTSILQTIFILLIICLYHKFTKTKPINFEFFENINNKQILLLAALLIVYIFPQMLLFIINSYSYPIPLLIINSIQFILIFVISFILVKNIVGYEKSQSDLFISELHNKTLVGMVDGIRTLKHDYNNIMQALNGYVLTKQYDRLQEHINSLLKECSNVNNLAVIDPKIINDPAIYGIVGSKYFAAEEKNVNFDFDIVTNIAEINFPKPDLSRIMGILLDNAIEAAQKSNEPYVRLEMHFDKRKCADVIKVINTYDKSIKIDTTEIFKKGYSTKEVKSGIGLWEVKKLIDKNANSQIYASVDEKHFVQTLVIEQTDDSYINNIS